MPAPSCPEQAQPRQQSHPDPQTPSAQRSINPLSALIGLGIEGEEGAEQGAEAGAEAAVEGVEIFSDEEAWDVLEEIPNDSAAALVLLEHHWTEPLRDAIARASGFRISDGIIIPIDLAELRAVSAEEAEELHAIETAGAAGYSNQPRRRSEGTQDAFRGLRVAESRAARLGV